MKAAGSKWLARVRKSAREKPFMRLVAHFVKRSFHGGAESDSDELDFGTGLLLMLLPIPGAFVSILFYDKYSSLLRLLRRSPTMNPYSTSLGDEYLFVVVSMVVTGIVAVWRWDSILLDRRDFANLAHLPVSAWKLFSSNLAAILFLTALCAFEVNIGSTLLFPAVVSSSYQGLHLYWRFAAGHAVGVSLASVFTFVGVIALIGLLMSCLPYSTFRSISKYLRILLVLFFLFLLMTTFVVASLTGTLPQAPGAIIRFLPSVWFLSLCETVRHPASPIYHQLGRWGLFAVTATTILAVAAYTLSFRRCFLSGAEALDATESQSASLVPVVLRIANRLYLTTPSRRACFAYVLRTLTRSEKHFTALGAFLGMGLVLSAQTMMTPAHATGGASGRIPGPAALSIPLILTYCLVVGLRFVFEIPTDLRANWIFKLQLDPASGDGVAMGRTLAWTILAPCLLLFSFPASVYAWGWRLASFHLAFVVLTAALLIETMMMRLRKIPFTCSLPVFRENAFVVIVCVVLGFFLFVEGGAYLEYTAIVYPLEFIVLAIVLVGWWLLIWQYRANFSDIDKGIIFEEIPVEAVQLLGLDGMD